MSLLPTSVIPGLAEGENPEPTARTAVECFAIRASP